MKSDGTVAIQSELYELFHPSLYAIESLFTCAPGVRIPVRTTFVKLPNDKLLVYSSTNPDLFDLHKLRELGDVVAIVVPNSVHMTYAQRMHEVFPSATVYCSPAVLEKDPNGSWGIVVREPLQITDDVLLFCISDMTPFREVVAIHLPSRTLLVADLAGNITPKTLEHAGIGAMIFCHIMRGFGSMNNGIHVMLMMWRFCGRARWQYEELHSMPWENVVPCHGDVLQKQGKLAFRDGVYKFVCSPSLQIASRVMPYIAAVAITSLSGWMLVRNHFQ